MSLRSLLPLISAVSFLSLLPLQAADFTIDEEADGIVIQIDGALFTKYVTGDSTSSKPYFYPVIGPTGKEMTRAYPMKDVEGEARDHPHQRSFYFGHQFVNDFDTWHEKLTLVERAKGDEAKLAEMMKTLGGTIHKKLVSTEVTDKHAALIVTSDYVDSSGGRMAEDMRVFVFRLGEKGERIIDVDIVFTPVAESVRFADAKDAGLSLRVAHSMSVDAKEGGRIATSSGHEDKDAWGKRADWCDFNGPVGGEKLGIAVLNHPSSFRYPTPWHARGYGLLTANPFGLKSVAGEEEDGEVILKKGESFTLKHRVIFHTGDEKDADIAGAWKAYAAEK